MPVLDEHHDLAHPVETDGAWSESYYFNCYDPVTDTGLFSRVGVRPNEGTIDVGLSVWLPGTEIAEYRFVREQREMIDGDLEVGGVRYRMLAPMKEWRITADTDVQVRDLSQGWHAERRDGHIALDLTFSALIPPIGVDGQSASARSEGASSHTAQSVGKGHLEQAGRWSGWIEADRARRELGDARGNRDKSWGPRRWGGPKMWRWFSINIGDDVHLGGIRIGTDAGDLHRGWIWRDGEHASIREWRVRTEVADDGLTHAVSHVTAVDKHGREHDLTGTVLRVAPAGRPERGPTTVVKEGLARWEYEGRTGHGISEYLHQLDDEARPVVPIE